MSQFQPYQHPNFQGIITRDFQFPIAKSPESFIFHRSRQFWYKAMPSYPFWSAIPSPPNTEWIGVFQDESEAASVIQIYGDTPPKPIVFYDLEAQLMKST